MRFSKQPVTRFLLFHLLLISACTPFPAADHYETDGIISIDITEEHEKANWQQIHYLNSLGLVSSSAEPDSSFNINSSFYLSNPGRYSFWILGSGPDNDETNSSTPVYITITGPDGFLVDQFQVKLSPDSRLQWISKGGAGENSETIALNGSGHYSIRINSGGIDGIQIHKIQMSFDDFAQPSGLGFPSSISPEINAAVLFREQQVMLPPDWYFGTIFGHSQLLDESVNTSNRDELNWPIFPDALWISSDMHISELLQSNQANESGFIKGLGLEAGDLFDDNSDLIPEIYDAGYRFLKVTGHVTPDQTEGLGEAQYFAFPEEERFFVLRSLKYAYDPTSLQQPAMTTEPGGVDWSDAPEVLDHSYNPGGLQEFLEAFSNPNLSTYNSPFLSLPVLLDSDTNGSDSDSELTIRRVQLASFMPVMHFFMDKSPASFFSSADARTIDVLENYTDLRSRLFPYIYTHAHVTRQTGEGIVRGFRDRENQYMFGDAFLVAPVTEPGIRELNVYFPGEGSWYDFHSGRRYAAGQSWVVEAPLSQLPLFVKAGSVIPYRVESGQIRNGNNDSLLVEIYTGNAGTFRLTEDDGQSRDYRRARAARTMFRYNEVAGQLRLTIGAVQSVYEGMNDYRSYELHFKHTGQPKEVTVNENMIEKDSDISWSYDDEASTVIIQMNDLWKHERTEIAITP